MGTIISPASTFNSTIPSTGIDPTGWHRWWHLESARVGTDWRSLLDAASAALSRLHAMHLSGASS